jgi:hypothetical protein
VVEFITETKYKTFLRLAEEEEKSLLRNNSYVVLIGPVPKWKSVNLKRYDRFAEILLPDKVLMADFKMEKLKGLNSEKAWNLVKFETRYRRQLLQSESIGVMRAIKKAARGKTLIYVYPNIYGDCPFYKILDGLLQGPIGD